MKPYSGYGHGHGDGDGGNSFGFQASTCLGEF